MVGSITGGVSKTLYVKPIYVKPLYILYTHLTSYKNKREE
jgi:hypothetical protein